MFFNRRICIRQQKKLEITQETKHDNKVNIEFLREQLDKALADVKIKR